MTKTRIWSQIEKNCYFLINYLNISYYFCLSPFHYKFDNGHFISSSWLPQKFYCALSSTLAVLWVGGELRTFIQNAPSRKSPDHYLRLLRLFVYTFQKCVILTKFWFNKKMFLKILSFLQFNNINFKQTLHEKPKLSIKLIANVILLCYIIVGFGYLDDGLFELAKQNSKKSWLLTTWERLINTGKYNYFIEYIFLSPRSGNTSITTDVIVGAASIIGFIAR